MRRARHAAVAVATFAAISVATDSQAATPLVVVTGGYDSCVDDGSGGISPFGSNFTAEGVRLVSELHGVDPGTRWLFSCFTDTSDLYVWGDEDSGPVYADGVYALVDRVGKLSDDYARPIFIIGHSHGGWLAMRLAEALKKPIKTGFLATLDPISFTECNASTYADALFNPWYAWSTTAPCRRAPGDFTAGDIQRIRANLNGNQWKHWWQDHFVPLHSGEIPGGPDFSLNMTPFFSIMSDGAASSWSAHTRIAYLSSIWFGLRQSIETIRTATP